MRGMKGTGWRTCSTGTGWRHGTMGQPSTRDSSIRERRMGRVGSIGRTGATMRGTLWMGSSKDLGSTTLQIWTNGTRENSG